MLTKLWSWLADLVAVLFGRSRLPSVPPLPPAEPPARPVTPPIEKPLVGLRPADDYAATKTQPTQPPSAVITRINDRHGGGQ